MPDNRVGEITGLPSTWSRDEVEGHIERASWQEISGWIWYPCDLSRRALVEVVHDGEVICRVTANGPRADLAAAGLGDGRYGFQIALPGLAFSASSVWFNVREAGSNIDLPGSPFALDNERPDFGTVRSLISDVMERLPELADEQDVRALSAFLLQQADRAAVRTQQLTLARHDDLARWSQTFEQLGGLSTVMERALRQARHQYGDDPLSLPTSACPDVSIIIPVHGKFSYTHHCLLSIRENTPKHSYEIILIDDASEDETVFASILLRGVRIVRNERNLGFVGSVNAGAQVARGRWLYLLNNDTQVTPGWLDELCDTFERDPTIGIVGSKLVFASGRLQEVGSYLWRMADGFNAGRDGDPDDPAHCYMRDADYVSGASLMIERRTWDEVGGLSAEMAPAYYDDSDLCFKVREHGRRVVVQPASRIVHHEGISAGTDLDGTGMKRFQGVNRLKFAKRWAHVLATHGCNNPGLSVEVARYVKRRVLVIDDSTPAPDQDAGSNASLSHMLSLQRLGYEVHFIPADNLAHLPVYTTALERRGIRCYYAPYIWSVEEVLRKAPDAFDLAYIHRPGNAMRHTAAIRAFQPRARILYCLADLHYLRMEREAGFRKDTDLMAKAASMKRQELAAACAVDAVISHSTHEADVLRRTVPDVRVAVIPWTVLQRPTQVPFADRSGVAFVGSYNHPPNRDAVSWLVGEIMPLVWHRDPSITLSIIGSGMGVMDATALDPRVKIVGWVPDLDHALHGFRLTAAPLRFGAGLKGKLLSSLAAGLPCTLTRIAAEGAGLPAAFDAFAADDADAMARCIHELHSNEEVNAAVAAAGLTYLSRTCSRSAIDTSMSRLLGTTTIPDPCRE